MLSLRVRSTYLAAMYPLPMGSTAVFDVDRSQLGTANLASHEETLREWIYQGRLRGHRTAYIARAIAFMAGAEAEVAFLGENIPDGDGCDREVVAELLIKAPGWVEARLRSWTRTLCRRHAHGIEAVAEALLREETLSEAQVRALTGIEKRPYVARPMRAA
jgi:hypothetical protein